MCLDSPLYTILAMAILWALPLVIPLTICIAVIASPLICACWVCIMAIQFMGCAQVIPCKWVWGF